MASNCANLVPAGGRRDVEQRLALPLMGRGLRPRRAQERLDQRIHPLGAIHQRQVRGAWQRGELRAGQPIKIASGPAKRNQRMTRAAAPVWPMY